MRQNVGWVAIQKIQNKANRENVYNNKSNKHVVFALHCTEEVGK